MKCDRCGIENAAGAKFCCGCGTAIANAQPSVKYDIQTGQPIGHNPVPGTQATTTSAPAVIGFILSLIGLLVLPLVLGIAAIVLSGVGISASGKNPLVKGKGLAIAGLVIGIVDIIVFIIIASAASGGYGYY